MEERPTPSESIAPGKLGARAFERSTREREPRRAEDLHVCPACGSELVLPTDWSPVRDHRWHVELRCPDCEWTGRGIYAQEVVDRFDEVLDEATEGMLADLQLLARANMEEEIDRFVAALRDGHILPSDF